MTSKNFLRLLILATLCWTQVSPCNILMVLPFGAKSHKNIFDAIGVELVKRGHEVTMYSILNEVSQIKGMTNVYIDGAEKIMNSSMKGFNFFSGSMDNLATLKIVGDIIFMIRDATYEQPEFRRLWEDPKAPKYDVMIIDTIFNEFLLPVGHRLNIPVVYVSPSIIFNGIAYSLNIPYPYSYLSSGLNLAHRDANFWQRATNAFQNVMMLLLRNGYLFYYHDKFAQTVFPNVPSLAELERNVSFVMTHTHPAFNPSSPSMPYTAEIACIHCTPSKKLPEELAKYFDNSGDAGVIYFSLGSATQGTDMPLEMRDKIVLAFSKLPQRILWKYENAIEGLPKNVKLTNWAPQQDILGHPKLRMFITHGGGLSTFEAAYHGCPVLGFPLSADQLGNVAHSVNAGFGEHLNWRTFTADDLVDKINLILNNKRYKEKALRLSRLLQDQPQHPKERAAYWIEYVIRHRGAPHLKSAADKLNFLQYFLLDVIGAIVLALLATLGALYLVVRTIFRLICGKRSETPSKKSKKSKKKTN